MSGLSVPCKREVEAAWQGLLAREPSWLRSLIRPEKPQQRMIQPDLMSYSFRNALAAVVCSFVAYGTVCKIRMNWSQAIARQGIATKNARETNCLMHSGTSVPAIRQSFNEIHSRMCLNLFEFQLNELKRVVH